MTIKTIIKRNGNIEEFIPSKLNKWGQWAANNLTDRVDWSEIILETVKNLDDSVTSKKLQQTLIKTCIHRKDWAHNLMAGRLYVALSRKDMFGNNIPSVKEMFEKMLKLGLMIEFNYTDEDYVVIESIIDHSKDFNLTHFQLKHIESKYVLQNRSTRKKYETPQFTYMRMACALAHDEHPEKRLEMIRDWYNHFSEGRISPPTPNYVNLGTPHRGFASCCLYSVGDSAKSLAVGDHIAYTMTYMSSGIGGILHTRSVGDSVKNGAIEHQGKLPYFNSLAGAVKANLQGGRGGACTSHYSSYDPEALTISQLQNPRSTEDRRNRDIHFSMLCNRLFAKKVAANEDIFTFNCYTAPDLYDAFFSGDSNEFERIYAIYESNPKFKKNYVNARKFIINATQQSYEVGTHYFAFIDEINRNTPFKEKIYSSNLCQEILLPTYPYENIVDLYREVDNGIFEYMDHNDNIIKLNYSDWVTDSNGKFTFAGNLSNDPKVKKVLKSIPSSEIALCTLASIAECNIKNDDEYRSVAYYALKMIDKCINMANYELPHIGYTAKKRMNAAVGLIGIAYTLAKNNLKYDSDDGRKKIHEISERHMYFLIEQSLKIAKERGTAEWINKTKWPDGWLPIDTYKKNIDSFANFELKYDWEKLRQDIIETGGIGHSSLVAHMPTEASSKAIGLPNGVYPIRELAMKKSDASNIIDWCAKDSDILIDKYQSAWKISSKDMIKVYAIIQKFTDHAGSWDLYKDRSESIDLSSSEMIEEFLDMVKFGIKTRYYQNSLTSDADVNTQNKKTVCASGACDV
uniref:ribonucleoside-diphosphate reductase n=1 Tax=viral metagenome TaxID=1070528 RepID=A0A6C0JVP5_9ZZZZ